VPELVQLDGQGYPVFLDMPVPPWLQQEAQQAVQMCPSLALGDDRRCPAPTVPGTREGEARGEEGRQPEAGRQHAVGVRPGR